MPVLGDAYLTATQFRALEANGLDLTDWSDAQMDELLAASSRMADAYINQTEPTYSEIGFAYMLQGDTPVSNSDPYATEATGPEDWVTDLGPHLMMLVPDMQMLASISTDHLNGGPWVMWPNTPYAHIMIPLESRGH